MILDVRFGDTINALFWPGQRARWHGNYFLYCLARDHLPVFQCLILHRKGRFCTSSSSRLPHRAADMQMIIGKTSSAENSIVAPSSCEARGNARRALYSPSPSAHPDRRIYSLQKQSYHAEPSWTRAAALRSEAIIVANELTRKVWHGHWEADWLRNWSESTSGEYRLYSVGVQVLSWLASYPPNAPSVLARWAGSYLCGF
jgi:hypothetical protein